MITKIEDYFSKGCGRCERFATSDCSTRHWESGLLELRRICRNAGLKEVVKWGHPCYMHKNRNIAILGAFRGDFRIRFFNPSLLKDSDGVLQKQGPNSQHPDMIGFTHDSQVRKMKQIIHSYLVEAMKYASVDEKPPKTESTLELPDELVDALDSDSVLSEAFHNLTPGRQKSYAINLNSAKKSETRIARIKKFRDKIIAGKGAQER